MSKTQGNNDTAAHYGFSVQKPGGATQLGQPMWPSNKTVSDKPLGDEDRRRLLEVAQQLEAQAAELRKLAKG